MKSLKKFLKSPIAIVLIAVILIGVGFSLINMQGSREVTTQEGIELIKSGRAEKVKIVDGENRVDVELTKPDEKFGKQVQFYFVTARADAVVDAVNKAEPAGGYNDEVPGPNWLSTALSLLLPLVLIGFFVWLMLSSAQGGAGGDGKILPDQRTSESEVPGQDIFPAG